MFSFSNFVKDPGNSIAKSIRSKIFWILPMPSEVELYNLAWSPGPDFLDFESFFPFYKVNIYCSFH